jgi:hypothetical protein
MQSPVSSNDKVNVNRIMQYVLETLTQQTGGEAPHELLNRGQLIWRRFEPEGVTSYIEFGSVEKRGTLRDGNEEESEVKQGPSA